MKAEHRHELKTNELAEWIANFPQWFQENLTTVIIGVAIVAGLIVYTVFYYHRETQVFSEKEAQTTALLDQVNWQKQTIIQGKQQGLGVSDMLLNTASTLQNAAEETENPLLSALAMIKRAEALRTELLYRSQPADPNYQKVQLQQAQKIYEAALEKAKGDPTVEAMAQYGVGICLEDMGNFAGAKAIYDKIAENPQYKGTLYPERAKLRADILSDNENKIIFAKSEKPQNAPTGQTEIKPVGPLTLEGPIADVNKSPLLKKSNSSPAK
jgi:tetratricopeptide (TPR) repeat protein